MWGEEKDSISSAIRMQSGVWVMQWKEAMLSASLLVHDATLLTA